MDIDKNMNMNFKNWFLIIEAKKPAEIALDLVGGDKEVLNKLVGILPSGIKVEEKNKYLLIAAYFHRNQSDLRTLANDLDLYHRLVGRNKMKLFTFDDKGQLNPQFRDYASYLDWTAAMHGMEAEDKKKVASRYKPSEGDFSRLSPIFTNADGSIRVFKAKDASDAIILGRGTNFCISQPGNTMFRSYRDSHAATFYFVFDSNRDDNLNIVVVDVGDSFGREIISLTDRVNRTGTCQNPDSSDIRDKDYRKYFAYLRSRGVDLSIFKNEPHSEAEEMENQLLGNENKDYNWFVSLSADQKSGYIGRGHSLSDQQFDFLVKHKLKDLLEQYVSTGLALSGQQLDHVLKDKDLGRKYMHFRLIGVENNPNAPQIIKNEYEFVKENMKDEEERLIYGFADFIDSMGVYGRLRDGFLKDLFDSRDEFLISELMKKIRKKLDATLGKENFGNPYIVPLSVDERRLLAEKDLESLKSALVQNSHAGVELSDEDHEILGDDVKRLHPHEKMMRSLVQGDEYGFKRHFDAGGHAGKPHGSRHKDYAGNYDDHIGTMDETDETTKLLSSHLIEGKKGIVDHILDRKISDLHSIDDGDELKPWRIDNELSHIARVILGNKKIDLSLRLSYLVKLLNSGANNLGIIMDDYFVDFLGYTRSSAKNIGEIEPFTVQVVNFYKSRDDEFVEDSLSKLNILTDNLAKIKDKFSLMVKSNYVPDNEKMDFRDGVNEMDKLIAYVMREMNNIRMKSDKHRQIEKETKRLDYRFGRSGKINWMTGKRNRR